ncbi:HD superfamily hydrolase [Vagococcus lutrae]|uniref:YfbR-like 5'-deoxynucleotidase n=1 Tax=Vagococcus lutrae TaxID=81947 RepID=UPI000F85DC52|nr:YfbR-like 5'-deoxynucleotidase [Vagococcus lutrae]MDT2807385.1 HD domain-containing protein [Vagococcus lutrae]MDT2812524.1 HD domain-containing protein [Vagococcus lutrae]RST91455.1 hydrolase [Vagococcus lutrae]GEQ61375.1 HD superfamily hydrolase [Vagococcus lutrae]GEQ63410.1 HD superfamily hydrolase [Vagococcus lutrae]
MGLNEFILGLNNLETITRAPGFFKYTEHTVAAHSYRVASIAQVLGDIEELEGVAVDWKMLYEKALNHDYTERFIGDIKTPVKYASPELRGMLQLVEEKMTDEFINQEIPEAFQDIYRRRLFEGKDDTIEGELLAIADKVDLLYESFEEIVKNNPEPVYQEMFMESIQTIQQFRHRPSVSYFFKEIFPELLDKDFFGKEQFVNRVKQYVTLSEGN